jgi:hypothetical protein
MVEVMLVTGILVAFIAGLYQMFLASQGVTHAITAVHEALFSKVTSYNCARAEVACTYNTDLRGKIIWDEPTIPEIRLPVVAFFRRFGLNDGIRLTSQSSLHAGAGPTASFKRTKLGVGAFQRRFDTLALDDVFGSSFDPNWQSELAGLLADVGLPY